MFERMGIVASIKKGQKKDISLEFYANYADYVSKCLRKPLVQSFLRSMLKREKIMNEKITNIQIRMFPSKKENGCLMIGKCTSNGEVFLYPKRLMAVKKKRQKQ